MRQILRYIYPATVQEYDGANLRVFGMGFKLPEKINIKCGAEIKVILEIPLEASDAKPD